MTAYSSEANSSAYSTRDDDGAKISCMTQSDESDPQSNKKSDSLSSAEIETSAINNDLKSAKNLPYSGSNSSRRPSSQNNHASESSSISRSHSYENSHSEEFSNSEENETDSETEGGNEVENDNEDEDEDEGDDVDEDDDLERIGRLPNLDDLRLFASTQRSQLPQLPQLPDFGAYTSRLQALYQDYTDRVRQAAADRTRGFPRPFPTFWPEPDAIVSPAAVASRSASISDDIEGIESMSATETLREILQFRPLPSVFNFRLFPKLYWDELYMDGSEDENDSEDDEVDVFKPADIEVSPRDLAPTFHPSGQRGCSHYQRNCKVQCITCEKWYSCRLCHDEVEPHALPRQQTKYMLCTLCGVPQEAAQFCGNCHEIMAEQYCDICKLWSTDSERHMFHCNDCGICRVGQGIGVDTFHCTKCDTCMDLDLMDNHTCLEKSTRGNCPICQINLFNSQTPIVFLRCGHALHNDCYESLIKLTYKCPICSKAIVDTSAINRIIDDEVAHEILPQEYATMQVDILCLECRGRSRIPFHLAGLKCAICHSYNTTRL